MPTSKHTTQTFRAPLEKLADGLGWTIARVPFDPHVAWKQMLRLRVCGTINGYVFRTSLFPYASEPGSFFLLVNRTMQQGAQAALGTTADFTLEPDLEDRPAELPDELAALLDEEDGLRAFYDSFTEYARREMGKWIAAVNSDEARMRRATQMAERLLATMEAEQELPPAIANALRGNAKAQAGWKRMTATQRRNGLFAVFSYASPEARTKRIAKLMDEAAKRAN